VVKGYLGPDAVGRCGREAEALRFLAGRLPVPALLDVQESQLWLGFVAGVPGQEALERHPAAVLLEIGRTARALHSIDPSGLHLPGDPGPLDSGTVLVHGDFGPQNLVFDVPTGTVAAVVDWEFAQLGEPVTDLAWSEWIVRTHHPRLAAELPHLYDGYGDQPPWPERRAAMLAKCEWLLDFVRRWAGDAPASELWQRRIATTATFTP
jgi:aminoglycoside phosphotransferase (APT) family kinase protein